MGDRPIVLQDLKKARRNSQGRAWNPPNPRMIIEPTFEEVMEWLDRPRDRLVFDLETLSNHIRCVGLADSADEAICIPFMTMWSGGG